MSIEISPLFKKIYNCFDDEKEIDDIYLLYKNMDENESGEFYLDIIAVWVRYELFIDIKNENEFVIHNSYVRSAMDDEYNRHPYDFESQGAEIKEYIEDFVSSYFKKKDESAVSFEKNIKEEFLSFSCIKSVDEVSEIKLNDLIKNYLYFALNGPQTIDDKVVSEFKAIFLP